MTGSDLRSLLISGYGSLFSLFPQSCHPAPPWPHPQASPPTAAAPRASSPSHQPTWSLPWNRRVHLHPWLDPRPPRLPPAPAPTGTACKVSSRPTARRLWSPEVWSGYLAVSPGPTRVSLAALTPLFFVFTLFGPSHYPCSRLLCGNVWDILFLFLELCSGLGLAWEHCNHLLMSPLLLSPRSLSGVAIGRPELWRSYPVFHGCLPWEGLSPQVGHSAFSSWCFRQDEAV